MIPRSKQSYPALKLKYLFSLESDAFSSHQQLAISRDHDISWLVWHQLQKSDLPIFNHQLASTEQTKPSCKRMSFEFFGFDNTSFVVTLHFVGKPSDVPTKFLEAAVIDANLLSVDFWCDEVDWAERLILSNQLEFIAVP